MVSGRISVGRTEEGNPSQSDTHWQLSPKPLTSCNSPSILGVFRLSSCSKASLFCSLETVEIYMVCSEHFLLQYVILNVLIPFQESRTFHVLVPIPSFSHDHHHSRPLVPNTLLLSLSCPGASAGLDGNSETTGGSSCHGHHLHNLNDLTGSGSVALNLVPPPSEQNLPRVFL